MAACHIPHRIIFCSCFITTPHHTAKERMCEKKTISTSEQDQVIPVMRAVQHGLSESPMLWGEEIDRMCSIELQKRGAPHGYFAIIFVDDTSVGVTQRDDKQLEELQKRGAPHEHLASTPITTALRPPRLAWQSQLKIRRLSKGSKKTQQLLSPACLLLSQFKACSKMRLKMVEKSQQAILLSKQKKFLTIARRLLLLAILQVILPLPALQPPSLVLLSLSLS